MDTIDIIFERHKKLMLESLGISEGVDDPAIFKAVFMAGGPGSGKSFVVQKTGLESLGFKVVNSDIVYEYMLKKAGMSPTPEDIYSPKGQQIRGASKEKTDIRQNTYLDGRLGLVIDGTGKDYAKIEQLKMYFESLGYETAMIFVNTNIETAQARNASRDRKIPKDQVQYMWSRVQDNIGKFSNLFGGRFFIIDSSENNNEDNIKNSTNKIYVQIRRWAEKPVNNPKAREWIRAHGGIM